MTKQEHEERIRKIFKDGSDKLKPLSEQSANLIVNAYELGFNTCWAIFTNEKSPMESSTSYHSKQESCACYDCRYRSPEGCGVKVADFCPLYIPIKSN